MKVFHIDNGRKYFSLEHLLDIVDAMGEAEYDSLELSIGNNGMRFLLDDMTIEAEGVTYTSEAVTNAVKAGNRAYFDFGINELTEGEMCRLINRCAEKNIQVIPLLNTPGHMDAIVGAMENLKIENVRYEGSATTIDLENSTAVEFTAAFVEKYVKWFSEKGIIYFNMGCDEYANDVLSSGFEVLCRGDGSAYSRFFMYVNRIASVIKTNGMTPIMFNDGMYYNKVVPVEELDKDIVCSYWSEGWPGYVPAPATFIEEKGHRILNTANNWYYVLGRRNTSVNPAFSIEEAIKGIITYPKDRVLGGIKGDPIGAMMCLWCDEPGVAYDETEQELVKKTIAFF